MHRLLISLLSLFFFITVLLAAPTEARAADVIRDGTELTLDLTAANACYALPASLRRPEPCEGFTPERVETPSEINGAHMLVMGFVHLPSGAPAQLLLMRQKSDVAFVNEGIAQALVRGYAKGAAGKVSKNARGDVGNAFVVSSGNAPFVRGTVDLRDDKPSVLVPAYSHHEFIAMYTKGSIYTFVAMGPENDADALRKIVEDAMVTTTVTHPVRHDEGASDSQNVSYQIGRLIAYVLIAALLGAVGVWSHRRTKRQQAEWEARAREAAMHSYGQYGQYGAPPPWHPSYQPPPGGGPPSPPPPT
jgi:hypothetical protein